MTENLPRVTSVLDLLSKPNLIQWASNVGVEYMQGKVAEIVINPLNKIYEDIRDERLVWTKEIADKLKAILDNLNDNLMAETGEIVKAAKTEHKHKKEEAANRGKRVHSAIEAFLNAENNATISIDEDLEKSFRKFMHWWSNNEIEIVELECPVWSEDGGGYKGTFDLACYITKEEKKILYLIDFKTSPRIYDDMSMQLAAYFYGWKARTSWVPDRAAILRLDFTDGPEEFYEILESELYVHYQAFIKVVELWHLIKN